MLEVQSIFKRSFGYSPTHLVMAPGRVEMLGNHTDYNEGLVMAVAINRYIHMAASPRQDGVVEVVSSSLDGREKFLVSNIEPSKESPWADYIKGVLKELQKRQVPFRGFNAAIVGTIPAGAGLSSSAALEVATALMIRELYPYTLTDTGISTPPERDSKGRLPALTHSERLNMARLCRKAECEFVGVNCGLLDQISSLFGKAFHVISIDCRDEIVEWAPLIGDVSLVVCNSGVKHSLVEGGYNELRQLCESAAQKLGVRALRSVDVKDLMSRKSLLTEREFQCAYHVVGEIQRVVFGERALREGDLAQYGQYMLQSHESSRDHFKNSCPELDLLVELARKEPACLGARLSGGGFGGATINLVKNEGLATFVERVATEYQKKTKMELTPMPVEMVDGAHAVQK